LEIPESRVAVVGDWYNDVPMFQWAKRSFAMPHAPPDVKQTATDVLPHGAVERGAIADALEAWMATL
jgi:hydroxymethylpyrimidine pyrophosphatase-like HAD family hydrolase